eukprot:CAMPEP_0183355510 /NCGR_PEP_ID=MMETSP0164_2-20130417/40718_1 /TAXON_ID=221442 /ORGANISM="Coccolithus pelagicus ssp braarudi, Strain PLY182g" /LENGTH=293 /DNA_ID=CAMNT_0025528639 /DNA_START=96 /DNA_END=973 /DNA_ORIENTATION=+
MPTIVEWEYAGGEDGSAQAVRRGTQHAYFGDVVFCDVFGQGKLCRTANNDLVIEFKEGDEMVERARTRGHVYALACREVHEPRAPVRKATGQGGILDLFKPGTATPPAIAPQPRKRQKGLGGAPAKNPGGKQKQKAPTAPAPPEPTTMSPLLMIGALYADSDDRADSDAATGKDAARAAPGKVAFRTLDAAGRAAYKHAAYERRKTDKHDHSIAGFESWAKKSPVHGWHCVVCIKAVAKPMDKFSLEGYGYAVSDDGKTRLLLPIPSRAKAQVRRSHVCFSGPLPLLPQAGEG